MDLWRPLAVKFEAAYESIGIKEHYATNLMKHLEGGEFPPCVKLHISSVQAREITAEVLKKQEAKQASEEEKRLIAFGARVWEAASEAKRVVNNDIIPRWQPPKQRPSGDGYSKSAILAGLLNHAWHIDVST